jgi:cysteine-rich repeat protein
MSVEITDRNAALHATRLASALVTALILSLATCSTAYGGLSVRASVDAAGVEQNFGASNAVISADGRFVAFTGTATNLVPNDTNNQLDVFVKDLGTGAVERASVASDGSQGNGRSQAPAISADGRFVAFVSLANNLVPGDTNGRFDVFVHDRMTGATERVNVASDGTQATQDSFSPSLSADGSLVTFASFAENLVPGDVNGWSDVFVRNRAAGTTEIASVDSTGLAGNGQSLAPAISADGRFVAFTSDATNLVASDFNHASDVYVHDRQSGVTEMASVSSQGAQGNATSSAVSISPSGRFVAFNSNSTNLVSGDGNGTTDVFVRDRESGTTERVSVASGGGQSNGPSGFTDAPAMSADGRFVAFNSNATNLVPVDSNSRIDAFVHDRQTGVTQRVNVAPDGSEADGGTVLPTSLSADGRYVLFVSVATNLVAGDTNAAQDVFVNDRSCGDGVVEGTEECDDANLEDGDGCSSTCRLEAVCGNGILEPREECDDANLADGDCCSAECKLEPAGSACDDGNLCTQSDVCDGAGVCVGNNPVVCPAPADVCHVQGACEPTTGACSNPAAPDGAPCSDGDVCTPNDMCAAGVCAPGTVDPAACLDRYACHVVETGNSFFERPLKTVTLSDEVESKLTAVFHAQSVCMAVNADGELATDSHPALTCYRIEPVWAKSWPHFDKHTVVAGNERGVQVLRVVRPRTLCLPSQVVSRTPGAALVSDVDRMKCYAARSSTWDPSWSPSKKVTFERVGGKNAVVGDASLVCNPASVDGTAIQHPDVHLACFELHEPLTKFPTWTFERRQLTVRNELGVQKLVVRDLRKLCVPSLVGR